MPKSTARLTWTLRGGDAEYFLDGVPLGKNEQGVRALMQEIERRNDLEKLVLDGPGTDVTGGRSVEGTYPFHPWYDELMALLNARGIAVEEAPGFGAP